MLNIYQHEVNALEVARFVYDSGVNANLLAKANGV